MYSGRKTKAVKTVLNQFELLNEAVSVVDLVEELQQEMSKTTVYRILERLEVDGTLHSFVGKNGRRWYARCKLAGIPASTHPHFQCTECGKVKCLPHDVQIPMLSKQTVNAAEFLLIGNCGECMPQS